MSNTILLVRRPKNFKIWDWCGRHEQSKAWWQNLFRIPYVEFRQELSKIAAENYEKLGADKIYYTIDDFVEDKDAVRPGDWVVPVDDDDWLCDDLCQTVKTLEATKDFIVWRCNIVSVFRTAPPIYQKLEKIQHGIFAKISDVVEVNSCSYALRNEIATYDNLRSHMIASFPQWPHQMFDRERECVRHNGLESCYLHMPSSHSAMTKLITSIDELKAGVEEVQKLDENLLAHRPEFVAKLKRLKELFTQL